MCNNILTDTDGHVYACKVYEHDGDSTESGAYVHWDEVVFNHYEHEPEVIYARIEWSDPVAVQ